MLYRLGTRGRVAHYVCTHTHRLTMAGRDEAGAGSLGTSRSLGALLCELVFCVLCPDTLITHTGHHALFIGD